MKESCNDCTKVENCAWNDTGIFPCPDFLSKRCLLTSIKVILVAHDPGGPPSWVPPFPGVKAVWVSRASFDQLKKLRYKMPCHICPDELKNKCEVSEELKNKATH